MNRERLNELIDALNEGSITIEERNELMRYYNSFQLDNSWDQEQMGNYDETRRRVFANIRQQKKYGKIKVLRKHIARTAAAIFLLGCGWLGYITWLQSQTERLIVISTDEMSKEIYLPDGTHVILNLNSRISYPSTFSADRREIKFEGEGYFDVQSDSLQPFMIETDLMKIKVVGTVFNLKSYKEDSKVETSLLEGKVILLSKDEKRTLSILEPNQKFIMNKETVEKKMLVEELKEEMSVEPLQYLEEGSNIPVDLAWREGKMAFHSAPLEDIIKVINRKYNVHIEIQNEKVASYTYTAIFDQESVQEILNALRIVKHFNYRKEDGRVIIY